MELLTVGIIQIAAGLIILITFFVMASNISKIRKGIATNKEGYWDSYRKHAFFGENKEAMEALKNHLWCEIRKIQDSNLDDFVRSKDYEKIKEKYSPLFENIGYQMPDFQK